MKCKGKVCFRLWSKNSGRSKTRIIDQERIRISFPMHSIRRIRNYDIKWLIIPVFWIHQGISMCNIKFFIIDIMEEHIDTTEVEGCDIDLLSIESSSNIFFSEYFCKLEKERT